MAAPARTTTVEVSGEHEVLAEERASAAELERASDSPALPSPESLPREIQIRQGEPDLDDDEDDDRVTNPGPSNAAWAGDPDDDAAWERESNRALATARDAREGGGPAGVMLRARPRRTAPEPETTSEDAPSSDPVTAPRARSVNDAPVVAAPLSRLDAPLFDDQVFARPRPAAREVSPRAEAPAGAPRSWRGWLLAGAIALLVAAGLTALRADAPSSSRGPARAPHVASDDGSAGAP